MIQTSVSWVSHKQVVDVGGTIKSWKHLLGAESGEEREGGGRRRAGKRGNGVTEWRGVGRTEWRSGGVAEWRGDGEDGRAVGRRNGETEWRWRVTVMGGGALGERVSRGREVRARMRAWETGIARSMGERSDDDV